MRQAVRILAPHEPGEAVDTITLSFDDRRKTRQRLSLPGGGEMGLALPWGSVLDDGARLGCEDGAVVLVRAAAEPLSEAATADPWLLARVAYHLGNRHVALAILPGRVRYQHDHVLDDMVRGLGVAVGFVTEAFQPEPGAYSRGHSPSHSHDHHHDHDH